jgi:hypothetical protein
VEKIPKHSDDHPKGCEAEKSCRPAKKLPTGEKVADQNTRTGSSDGLPAKKLPNGEDARNPSRNISTTLRSGQRTTIYT